MKFRLHIPPTLSAFVVAVVVGAAAAACDLNPAPANSTTPVASLSTPARPAQPAEPVSQGWVFNLSSLTEANHYRLDLDVLAPAGFPVGVLSFSRGSSYEQQGQGGLISSVKITTKGGSVLELASAAPSGQANGSTNLVVARENEQYDRTSAEGWHVRTKVKGLSLYERPTLSDGKPGPVPAFATLELDVDILSNSPSPYLGFVADNVVRQRAALENLRGPDLELLDHGVVVRKVMPNSPAAKAGLREGDVVLSLNGKAIDQQNSLSVLLNRFKVGDTVKLEVVRDEKAMQVDVVLEKHL